MEPWRALSFACLFRLRTGKEFSFLSTLARERNPGSFWFSLHYWHLDKLVAEVPFWQGDSPFPAHREIWVQVQPWSKLLPLPPLRGTASRASPCLSVAAAASCWEISGNHLSESRWAPKGFPPWAAIPEAGQLIPLPSLLQRECPKGPDSHL